MALSWRQKRKTLISSTLTILVVVFLAILIVPRLQTAPSCFDGKQNGDESGVDCGGSCALFCPNEVREPAVRFARVFPVTGNFYNALALIENQNPEAGLRSVAYEFKFYDSNNIFIKEYQGKTFLGLHRSAIFAGPIDLEGKIPKRVTFSFIGQKDFIKIKKEVSSLNIFITDKKMTDLENRPKLSAKASNQSGYTLKDIDFIAILYDKEDNTVSISKTHLEKLANGEEKEIFFTWPKPLEREINRIEILPQINPFLLPLNI